MVNDNIVDRFLLFTQRRPGIACSGILIAGVVVVVAYWIAAGHVGGDAVMNGAGLAVLTGAYFFVCRHMERQARTPENHEIESRTARWIKRAKMKHASGQLLTEEDCAALRASREIDLK